MKKILSLLLISVFAFGVGWAEEVVVEKTLAEVATANNWTVSAGQNITCYTSFDLDENITISTTGEPNCGSFWGSDWRLYQNKGGNVIVTAANSCTLKAVTFTFTISNSGALLNGTNAVTSATAVEITGTSAGFTVGNSGTATNGQVRITKIAVTYETNEVVDGPAAPTFSFSENEHVNIVSNPPTIYLPEGATRMTYGYGTSAIAYGTDDTMDREATGDVVLDMTGFEQNDYIYVNAMAFYADGSYSAIARTAFYVSDPNHLFPINASVETGAETGTISCPESAKAGDVVEVEVTPAQGYHFWKIEGWYDSGQKQITFDGTSFTMPELTRADDQVIISVYFAQDADPNGGTVTFVAGTDTSSGLTITKDPVTLTLTSGTLSRTDNYRVYKNANITISAASGYTITGIDFTCTSSNPASNFSIPANGTWETDGNNGSWTGNAQEVTLTASAAQVQMTQIDVTYVANDPDALALPVIDGTTPFVGSTQVTITNPNDGGDIYYTINGDEPTASSNAYTEPFTITESTTVKAIVVLGDKTSAVAQMSFVALPSVASIDEFIQSTGTVAFANPVIVLGQNNQYLYVQDETSTRGLLIYGNVGQSYEFGDVIPAGFSGSYSLYNGQYEMANPVGFEPSTSNVASTLMTLELTPSQVGDANFGRYAVIKGASIVNGKIVVGEEEVALYDRFKWTAPADLTQVYDIYGVASVYSSGPQFLPLKAEPVAQDEGVALAEILASGENGAEYTIADDLAVVDIAQLENHAFVTDGNNNWLRVDFSDDIEDFVMMNAIKGGTLKGTLSNVELNPVFTVTEMPQEGENTVDFTVEKIDLAEEFTLKANQVIDAAGYWRAAQGCLRGYLSGGQSLTINSSWATTDNTMVDGQYYSVRCAISLKEAWKPTAGIAPKDYDYDFQNYLGNMLVMPSAPTAIEDVNASSVKSVRYYNIAGIESSTPFQGVNIVVREMNDGSKVTTKIVK